MHSHPTASDVIAAQVRRHRNRLGLNREQLAEECARLGADDLTYAALTNIETGRKGRDGKRRREVTVDELLVLGLALAVPPLLLTLPLGSEQAVPTAPNRDHRNPYTVWKWWTGEETPTLGGPLDGRYFPEVQPIGENGPRWSAAWAAAAYPASLYPEFERRRREVQKAQQLADDRSTDKERNAAEQAAYIQRLDELARHINDMARAGLTVPDLQAGWIEDMRGLDMLDNPDELTPKEDD